MKPQNPRARVLALGFPKAGKTGTLAALVNSGRFELGLLDFDHNPDPLYSFVRPEFYDRISIVTLQDNIRDSGKRIAVSGEPVAFRNALRALDHWVDDEGRDWGAVKEWEGGVGTESKPARVLCMDGLTSMGVAAFRRRRHYRSGGSTADDQQADWKAAMDDEDYLMEILASPKFSCHVVALSHIKMIEPKILAATGQDPSDIKQAKAAISRLRAENVAVRFCPSALGNALPPEIARHFPAVVLVDGNRAGKRVIVTSGEEGFNLGVPARGVARVLSLDTGLLTIFDAILAGGVDKS